MGYWFSESGRTEPFIWGRGELTDLGHYFTKDSDGWCSRWAADINNAGTIVGTSQHCGPSDTVGFVLSKGVVTELDGATLIAVNERGDVLGSTDTSAFIWRAGITTEITIDGCLPSAVSVHAINDTGLVAASCDALTGPGYAWRDGEAIELTPPLGGESNWVLGISQRGQVAGASRIDDVWTATVWSPALRP